MNFDCDKIAEIAPMLPLVRSCDRVRSGALRLSTPFHYPNGETIDVFIYLEKELLSEYRLSDFGQTYVYLRHAQTAMLGTSRKREIVSDIASQMNVDTSSGELTVLLRSDEPEELCSAIMRLAQACMRISDLATHQRLRSANPFRDDVEDFFDSHRFSYVPDVKVVGPYNVTLKIDFEVKSGNVSSYVNILAALNPSAAHSSATEIFAKWHDMTMSGNHIHKLVTIYNSASAAIKNSDIQRLGTYSSVISYPEQQDTLTRVLSGEIA